MSKSLTRAHARGGRREHEVNYQPRKIQSGPEILPGATRAARWFIALLVFAASAASFTESYHGLFDWSSGHDVHGGWALVWPLQIDVFIVIGEAALFIAMTSRWTGMRWPFWMVAIFGLLVSVAGNVGHVSGLSVTLTDRLTASVPPLAAFASLAVGMAVLKQVTAAAASTAASEARDNTVSRATVAPDVLTAARLAYLASVQGSNPLSVRQLADRFGITRPQAGKVIASAGETRREIEASSPIN